MKTQRTLAWRYIQRSPLQLVAAHSEAAPTEEEWNRYVAEARAAGETLANTRGSWALVMSDGGGPNGAQRKAIASVPGIAALPTAVVSSSLLTRGMVTATAWLGKEIRAFAPEHIDRAYAYLGISPEQRTLVVHELASLRAELLGEELADVRRLMDLPESAEPAQVMVGESLATIRDRMSSVSDRLKKLKSPQKR